MRRESGFTLLEVMIAMLIGTIGLLGTIAVQQAIISSSKNANDAAVAMRLASQKIEELSSRTTDTRTADLYNGLGRIASRASDPPLWLPTDSNLNAVPEYVDAAGIYLRDISGFAVPPQSWTPARACPTSSRSS
jgi:prepilin-type N-terminal cleavage/methylation domain-containing protein